MDGADLFGDFEECDDDDVGAIVTIRGEIIIGEVAGRLWPKLLLSIVSG